MKRALTPGLQRRSDVLLRRLRSLPVKGEILVQPGAEVSARDIVARAELPGDLLILRLPEKMGLDADEVLQGLKIKAGDKLSQGDLICERSGLFGLMKSRFFAPSAGDVEFISAKTGHLGLRAASRRVEVSAYLSGRVVEVDPGKSLIIEASATLVQGIFGVGGERSGVLKRLAAAADEMVQPQHIPADAKGLVLFGGASPSLEALRQAATAGAVGFVCGSIDDRALSGFLGYDIGIAMTGDENISMTVILTEGFGSMPMSQRALDLLLASEGKLAVLNGATQVRAGAVRPEVIICQPPSAADRGSIPEIDEAGVLKRGARIRIVRHPYFGMEAEVLDLPQEPERIETGATTRILRAKLLDGRAVSVPRANVELV